MATAVEPWTAARRALLGEQRVIIREVDWDGYESLLRIIGDGPTRVTYNGRDAELRWSSHAHELYSVLIRRLIDGVTEELSIPCHGAGATTWRKRSVRRGLEADECYYLASLDRIRGQRGNIDLEVDPPPDLCVDVEITLCNFDRLAVYAALGVPEVWRFDGETLDIQTLRTDGTYASASVSPALPMVPPSVFVRWIKRGETLGDQTRWIRQFRDWLRVELLPGYEGEGRP